MYLHLMLVSIGSRTKIQELILCIKGSGTFHIIHTANMMARELEIRNLLQLIYEILFNENVLTYFFLS